MKKLLSIFLFSFVAYTAAIAQEDICSVVNTILTEADSLITERKDADALALLRAAQIQPELRTCSNYSRLADEIERIETNQYLVIPVNEKIRITMIKVKGGTFQMGATSEQGNYAESDEKPVHRVTLSDYYIGQTEVKQALWQAVMGNNPSNRKGPNLPVEKVSWEDCQQFITKLNQLTGKKFHLPTEAEWEYAARGGNKSRGYKYAGSNNLDSVAWYTNNSGSMTRPVGQKQANELGVYDMTGNVWEWCQDGFGPYNNSDQKNPKGSSTASTLVNRGASFGSVIRDCRISIRGKDGPNSKGYDLGLRLAL